MERWMMADPARVYERMERQQQRRHENSKEGRAMIAVAKMEAMFDAPAHAEPLFSSAHAAIVFALNYNHQQYDKPLMNRLSWGALSQGKGLSGIDGAAQAGMIRGMIGRLSDLECAMLIAYCAPKQIPIPGSHQAIKIVDNKQVRLPQWSTNPEYQAALRQIARTYQIHALTSVDQQSVQSARLALVARCFGERVNLQEAADHHGIPYRTYKRMHAGVRDYLLGKRGGYGQAATLGAIQQAMNKVENMLREQGVID